MDTKNAAAIIKSLNSFYVHAEKLLSTRICESGCALNYKFDDSIQLDFEMRLKKEEFLGDSATMIIRKAEVLMSEFTNKPPESVDMDAQLRTVNITTAIIENMTKFRNSVGEINCENKEFKGSLKTIKGFIKSITDEASENRDLSNDSTLAA
jgi:hypothetical protein